VKGHRLRAAHYLLFGEEGQSVHHYCGRRFVDRDSFLIGEKASARSHVKLLTAKEFSVRLRGRRCLRETQIKSERSHFLGEKSAKGGEGNSMFGWGDWKKLNSRRKKSGTYDSNLRGDAHISHEEETPPPAKTHF